MTSHPSVGLSRPHIRAPSRTTSLNQYPSSGLVSKHVLIDLTDAVRGNRDGEALSKRRKTENDSSATQDDGAGIGSAFRHGGNSNNSRQASRRRQFLPFEAQLAQAHFESPSESFPSVPPSEMLPEAEKIPQSLPPLPMRPGSHASSRSHRQHRVTGIGGASGREGVQARPYVLEAPPFAPHFEQDSMLWFYIVT